MEILTFPVGQLKANCYFAVCEETQKTTLIDPGGDANFLIQKLQDHNLKPQMIVATHGHFDHVLGVTHLQLCLEVPFYIHNADLSLLKNASHSASYWTSKKEPTPPPRIDNFLSDGQIIKLGKEELKIIHTPGHTPGSVCLYNKKGKVLFSGDLLFKNGVGRSDFSYSSRQELQQSLKEITRLPKETLIYPGHGEEFKLENRR